MRTYAGVYRCSCAELHMGVDVHMRVCQSEVTLGNQLFHWDLGLIS